VPDICPATLLLDGCDDDADTSGARGGDVVAMPMLGLVGLRGLRGLKPPARPCGVDLLDRIGETVGGDDLHKEGRSRVNHDKHACILGIHTVDSKQFRLAHPLTKTHQVPL
jgi:hypothetical protein